MEQNESSPTLIQGAQELLSVWYVWILKSEIWAPRELFCKKLREGYFRDWEKSIEVKFDHLRYEPSASGCGVIWVLDLPLLPYSKGR